tara:strand:- start:18604 stop:20067 length:1464 start_codon:yes stop_codon:yes gene_type:complete
MTEETFFISSAVDYPSGPPHAGHMYEKILCDVLARWHRLKGEKVHFSTGLDCYGSKIAKCAEQAGKSPEEYVKEMEKLFLQLCKSYNISYDDFIKTTEERHKKVVYQLIEKLEEKGDIYKDKYSGYYCSDCETYLTEQELLNGKYCPTHTTKKTEFLEEEAYFFKMSKYQEQLLAHFTNTKNSIVPAKRKNDILNRLKEPLRDFCLTRKKVTWGVPYPLDKKFIVSIWAEALMNYLTTVDYPGEKYKTFWPAEHVIGYDISWHHTLLWSSLLYANNIEQPKVLIHGFINDKEGKKMSKSLGNVVDPLEIIKRYPADALRYFLIREIPFGEDGDFSEEALKNRLNNELANDLGNLLSRSLTLVEKYCKGKVPKGKNELPFELNKIEKYMEKYELHNALSEIWKYVNEVNKYINDKKPWEAEKKENILYTIVDSLRIIAVVLEPFIPETTEKINQQLGRHKGTLKEAKVDLLQSGGKIKKGEHLFEKIE